jgi:hypothetical protein
MVPRRVEARSSRLRTSWRWFSCAIANPLMPRHGTRVKGHRHGSETTRLLGIECRGCGAWFGVCGGCYRGQRHCSDGCREKARTEQKARARRRYAQSAKGRANQAQRQRRYRRHPLDRRRAGSAFLEKASSPEKSVTDRSTAALPRLYTQGHAASEHRTTRDNTAAQRPYTLVLVPCCQRCGKRGRVVCWVPTHAVSPSTRRLW